MTDKVPHEAEFANLLLLHRVSPRGAALHTLERVNAINALGVRIELNEARVAAFIVWARSHVLTMDHVMLHKKVR